MSSNPRFSSRRLGAFPVALFCLFSAAAWAQGVSDIPSLKEKEAPSSSDFRVSGGVRLWSAKWDSWNVNPTSTGVSVGASRYEVVESMQGSEKLAVIPFLSARYGAWYLSASTMAKTSYQLHDAATPLGFDVDSSRAEFDVNLGYLISPGVSVSLGNKRIHQRFGQDEYKWNGPVLGLNANAPLGSGWNLYTSLGLGRLRGAFPRPDAAGHSSFRTDYRLMEGGLTYAFLAPTNWIRSVVLTAGYRTQRMSTKGYGLAATPAGGPSVYNTSSDLVDTTQGLVLGLQGTF